MAKKRGLSDSDRKESKRLPFSKQSTPMGNEKKESNILNDSLLKMYKKGLEAKKESLDLNETSPEDKPKDNDASTKTPARAGKRSKTIIPKNSTVDFSDVGGLDNHLKEILHMLVHFQVPTLFKKSEVPSVGGILLYGPPGCGKTHLARAIAGQLKVPLIEVMATELVHGISGESENKIRGIFEAAVAAGRCILFIDEIDVICPKRATTDNEMSKRMVAQMIKCLDELRDQEANVVVIGATNTPDSIDTSLRRGLRFTRELSIGLPNEEARFKILKILCKKIQLTPDFDFHWLAHHTPGYVGADLTTLVFTAMVIGLCRMYKQPLESDSDLQPTDGDKMQQKQSLKDVINWFESLHIPEEEMGNIYFTLEDFKAALKKCVPSSKREGFASVPDTTWDDIGSYENIKKELRKTIMWPVQYSKYFEENNLSSSKGILLYGPKGCGKTLLAKAIANECSINFLAVNGPELLNMYVGESEKAVRRCFERARNSAPCVIFFDEFDALCPPRSSSKENVAIERVVNQLLTEAAGIQERKQVFLVAATNRLDKIDSAMLRPGRLDKILYVGLPTHEGRVDILKSLTKKRTLDEGLNLETIAFDSRCEEFSGADLTNLVDEACFIAMEEMIESPSGLGKLVLSERHFAQAFKTVKSSFSEWDRKYFQQTTSRHSNVQ